VGEFKWDGKKEEAAVLIAQGELTTIQIGQRLGVSDRMVYKWKAEPEFAARVEETVGAIRADVLKIGIADVVNRIKRRDLRWNQIKKVTISRAALLEGDDKSADSGTGLIVHSVKMIGSGPNAMPVDVYEFDAALLKEEREIEKQAAIELGQWQEKTDVTSGGKPFESPVVYLPSNGRDVNQ
jgi:hypothetical protein